MRFVLLTISTFATAVTTSALVCPSTLDDVLAGSEFQACKSASDWDFATETPSTSMLEKVCMTAECIEAISMIQALNLQPWCTTSAGLEFHHVLDPVEAACGNATTTSSESEEETHDSHDEASTTMSSMPSMNGSSSVEDSSDGDSTVEITTTPSTGVSVAPTSAPSSATKSGASSMTFGSFSAALLAAAVAFF